MNRVLAVALLMIPSVVWGQGAPDTSRLPPVRPEAAVEGDGAASAPTQSKLPPDTDAAPRSETPQDGGTENGQTTKDPETQPEPLAPPVWQTLQETDDAFVACLGALNELGAVYKVADPQIEDDRDCGIANAVRVSQAVPVTSSSGMQLMPDGKLSEHAFGNAIDIMAFGFKDGSQIKVAPREREGSREESFQDAVRATACLHFTTVLGPGSDDAHSNHLHLDVIARSGGFRLCQ